jgi:hypothetical protein
MTGYKRRRELKQLAAEGDENAIAQIKRTLEKNKNSKRLKREEESRLVIQGNVQAATKKKKSTRLNCLTTMIGNCLRGICSFTHLESGRPPCGFTYFDAPLSQRASQADCENYISAFYSIFSTTSIEYYSTIGLSFMDGERARNRIIMKRMLHNESTLSQAVPPVLVHPGDSADYWAWQKKFNETTCALGVEDDYLEQISSENAAFYQELNSKFPSLLRSATDRFEGPRGRYRAMWLQAIERKMHFPVFDMTQGIFMTGYIYINKYASRNVNS